MELVAVWRLGSEKVPHEIIPPAAGHVTGGAAVRMRLIGQHEQIEIPVRLDERVDDEQCVVRRDVVVQGAVREQQLSLRRFCPDLPGGHIRHEQSCTGYRAPELEYTLGLTLVHAYQEALARARLTRDDAERRLAVDIANRRLRDPALGYLRSSRASTPRRSSTTSRRPGAASMPSR